MAIIKIRNTAIDLDAAEIPNIDASKITSGTISSSRISGLPASSISSGTFSDARIAASNVSQHASSFDDNKIVNDISTLAIRQASDNNKSAYNTNSQFVDVFQDSTGVQTFTSSSRNSAEYVASSVLSAGSLIDFTSIDGSGTDVKYKTSGNLSSSGFMNNTSFTNMSDANANMPINIDTHYQLNNNWSAAANMIYAEAVPKDATDRTNYWIIYDFGETFQFGGVWYIGKQNGYGDMRKFKLQSSTDDSSYTDIDMSGVTTTSTSYSGQSLSSGSKSGGTVGSASSDGSFILAQHGGIYFSSANTMANFPTTDMRYLKMYFMNQYTGTTNANAGFTFNITKKSQTFNATGNFIGNTITASSSVNKMGAIITYQDQAGTNALNSDIVLQLSADGGSNFTTATMTALPDFSTGIKMAKVNDLTIGTAGTSLKYKLSFANQASGSKEARIRGVSLQY